MTTREKIDRIIADTQSRLSEIPGMQYDDSIPSLHDGYYIIRYWESQMRSLEKFRNYIDPVAKAK